MIESLAPRLRAELAWSRLLPPWPILVGLAALARALAQPAALLNDPDTYLHIAAGSWILARQALPAHDPFSFTMPATHWTAPEWLAEIILALCYRGLGWAGPVLLAAVAYAVALGLLTRFLLRRLDPLPALVLAIAAAALLLPHLLARPHAFALPLLVAWAGVLLAARDAQRPPPFAALPLMVLWANLHGSFAFGLALAAFLGAEAVFQASPARRWHDGRTWAAFAIAAAVAALLTPNGLDALVQPFRLMAMPALRSSFIEWMSPNLREFPALEAWILGALFLGLGAGLRLPPMRAVLVLGLVHMALQHLRHADILALVAPLAVAAPLGDRLRALSASSALTRGLAHLARPPGALATTLAFAAAAALAAPIALHPPARTDDPVTPRAALDFAEAHGLRGPVFNAEAFGGYLAFRGVPDFIDGRIEMFGNDFLADDVAAERGNAAMLAALLGRYRIEWTLLPPGAGAVAALDRLPGWQRVYTDPYAVIHRRIAPAP
ncbi:MAG TPA: hypothetical protein VFA12_17420 [Stellaceae bacterium]|nr:hypothetical protein [Stellaceae bacterium]